MATLPNSPANLTQGVTFEEQPSLTWYVDPVSRQVKGTADGLQAVAQTVEIILSVERFLWQIYGPDFGMQWQGLIGKDPGYVASELQRRVLDAFSVDSRINGISEFSHSVEGDTMTVSMTVDTVYGPTAQTVELKLNA